MSKLQVTDAVRLNYEINLECDACGHAQFLHCENHSDPCGCQAMYRRGQITRDQCHCSGFVRPPNASAPPSGFWRSHSGCDEESA